MSRPGVDTLTVDTAPPFVTNTDTGQAFVAASTSRGPVGAQLLQSLADYSRIYGPRITTSMGYDWIDTAFKSGAGKIWMSRMVGPAATSAAKTLLNTAVAMLNVTAIGPGTWGNGIQVTVVSDGGGLFHLLVGFTDTDGTVYSEQSPSTNDPSVIASWSFSSQWVRVTVGTAALAAASITNLTGGTDDLANENDTALAVALALFHLDLGPGQVSAPGRTAVTSIQPLADHAAAMNRVVLADAPDTASAATIEALAVTVRALANARYVQLLAPWVVVPGIVGGTTRRVPYSAVQAALVAQADETNPASFAVAGPVRGRASYPLDVTQTYIASDRAALSTNGVTVGRNLAGAVETFDYVSAANPSTLPQWVNFGTARLVMWAKANGRAIADSFQFAPLDGNGQTIAAFAAQLAGMLKPMQDAGAIYGNAANPGYRVDTSANTPTTIANNELHATMLVRCSPFAQWIAISIVDEAISNTGV